MENKKTSDCLTTSIVKIIFGDFYEKPFLPFPSAQVFFVILFYQDNV